MKIDVAHACPVCSEKSILVMQLSGTGIYRCSACRHAFSAGLKDSVIYNEEYFYQKHKNYFSNPDIQLYGRIADILRETKTLEAEILDVGCGTGSFLKFLKKEGFCDLTGIDLEENVFEGISFIQDDFMEHVFVDKYDVIITMMNIEHITDVREYIKKIRLLLKDDGLLIVNTIDENALIYVLARILYRLNITFAAERLYEAHHVNHFSRESLRRLCEIEGMSNKKTFAKNYPLRSVDVPYSGFKSAVFKSVILLIFIVSLLSGMEISQTQIFSKK